MKYLLIIILLLGCENKTRSISTIIGTGGGGYASYLIAKDLGGGNKYVIPFVIAGSLIGGFIGSEIGENLDSKVASSVLENNKTNQSTSWSNPDKNLEATITPTKTFKNEVNDDCREFEYEYIHKGEKSSGKNVACRDADGNWVLLGKMDLSPL